MKIYHLETSFDISKSFHAENDEEAVKKAKELAGHQLKKVYYIYPNFHVVYENYEPGTMVST